MSDFSPVFEHIPSGTIHRTIGLLHGALTRLKARLDNTTIERIGVMVHRAMSTQQRSFHTPEHIFELSDPEDAHTTLAAIFHDVVYYQVDDGFLPEIAVILKPYVEIDQGVVRIRRDIPATDRAFFGCAAVFGFEPGQELSPFGGLNEFLSALLMDALLEGTVPDVDLLIATACIEATIPFRGPDAKGAWPPERLESRISRTNDSFHLGLTKSEIVDTVIRAVCFSNRDVANFAEEDSGRFLDNTWKLLPETNPELRFRGLYTIRNYSIALMKMEGFLSNLKADNVFNRYHEYPVPKEYQKLVDRTRRNLNTARLYLGVKMVSAGVLLGLAELSGGDAPIAFFMGDINPLDDTSDLASHLPDGCLDNQEGHGDDVDRLLEQGRASSSAFDLQNSPLSLYIHRCLDPPVMTAAVQSARDYFQGKSDSHAYLTTFPGSLVAAVAHAAAQMAFTRRDALLAIAGEFGGQRRQ